MPMDRAFAENQLVQGLVSSGGVRAISGGKVLWGIVGQASPVGALTSSTGISLSSGDVVLATRATITTKAVSSITAVTATCGGDITADGGAYVTARGVCWNTSGNPSIDDNCTDSGEGTGSFTSEISGLSPSTTYYVSAYATNSQGSAYGSQVSFTTATPTITVGAVTDFGEVTINTISPEQSYTVSGTHLIDDIAITAPEGFEISTASQGQFTISLILAQTGGTVQATPIHIRFNPTLVMVYAGNILHRSLSATDRTTPVSGTCTKADQTISFGALGGKTYGDPDFVLTATASSGFPVTYTSSNTEVATVSGSTVTITGAGTTTIIALQIGDGATSPAPDVEQTLTINPKGLTVTADDKIRLYGRENPPLTFQYSGWAYDEGVDALTTEPAIATGATASSPPGEYDIVPSDGAAVNYTFNYIKGTLTVFETVRATIADPPAHSTNEIAYNVTVNGFGVVGYRYKVDQDNWSEERDISTLLTFAVGLEGDHTLSVIGVDTTGIWQFETDATTVKWTIDLTPPRATLTNVPKGTVGVSSIDAIVGGADVRFYEYRLIQPGSSAASAASLSMTRSGKRQLTRCGKGLQSRSSKLAWAGSLATSASWSAARSVEIPIEVTDLEEGEHQLQVIGMDPAGNWQDDAAATTATWVIDSSVPTAVLSALPEPISHGTMAQITVDGDGLPQYKYSITGPAMAYDGTWSGEIDMQEPIAFEVAGNGSEDGEYTLYVNAGNGKWQDGGDGTSTESATMYTWIVDTTAPDTTMDLGAVRGRPASTAVELSWSAVQDGLTRYRVWYSEDMISDQNLNDATELYCNIIPGIAGYIETFKIDGIAGNRTYYFAIQSVDAATNDSDLSSIASAMTSGIRPTITGLELTTGGRSGDNDTAEALTITGEHFFSSANGNIVRFSNSDNVFDVPSQEGGSSTFLQVDVPVGAPTGSYRIRVINSYGTSLLSDEEYTVTTPSGITIPEVSNISPLMGRNDLWTLVTIKGENFGSTVDRITLGQADGTIAAELEDIEWVSDTEIKATVPLGVMPGQYCVQVHGPNGNYNWVSAVRFEVHLPIDLCDVSGTVSTTIAVDLPDDAIIPVTVVLATDDRPETAAVCENNIRVIASMAPGTTITDDNGVPYTDAIDPPRQVPVTDEMADQLSSDPSDAVVFTMGSPTEKLRLGQNQTLFVELDIMIPSTAGIPSIYYLEANGSLTLAGVDGQWNTRFIDKGGTIFSERIDTPEIGQTTYTMGLLLDHMSTLGTMAVRDTAAAPPVAKEGDHESGRGGSGCFITTAARGIPMIPESVSLAGWFAVWILLLGSVISSARWKKLKKVIFTTFWLPLVLLAFQGNNIASADEAGSNKIYQEAAETLKRLSVEDVEALDEKLAEALVFYYDGKFDRALPIFRGIEEIVTTMDIMFWAGISAANAGEYHLAITYYEKMLTNNPDLFRVRLELATVHYLMGRYDRARNELEKVLGSSPPPSVQRNVEKLLARIEAQTNKSTWGLSLSQGYMWDDNISRSTAEKELDIFGGGFAPDETFRALSSGAYVTNVYANLRYDIGEKNGWMWNTTASFSGTLYHEYSQFNLFLGDVNTGLWFLYDKAIIKIPLGLTKISYGSDQLSYIYHVDPTIEHYFNTTISLKGLFSYGYTDYYENRFSEMDNDKFRYELSSNIYLSDRRHIFSVSAGLEDANAKGGKYAYQGYYGGISYFTLFPMKTELLVRYRWLRKDYRNGKALPLYDAYRNDRGHFLSVSLSRKFLERFFASLSYSYSRNDSNLALYTYDRQTYSINLGLRF